MSPLNPTPRPHLPGLAGLDHVGLTVPDTAAAVAFFENIIGCELAYAQGPFRDPDPAGTFMADDFGLHPRAELVRLTMLRCFNGSNIELHEYHTPDQRREMPRMSDVGAVHLALYTDRMDAAIAYLRAQGIRVLGHKKEASGPEAGPDSTSTFIYTYTPWGLPLELVSFPRGKAYDRAGQPPLFQPAHAAKTLRELPAEEAEAA